MNKILLVIQREYLTRVKKKSFIIMTLLAPVLMAAFISIIVFIMSREDDAERKVAVIGEGAELYRNAIPSTKKTEFVYLPELDQGTAKKEYENMGFYGYLVISPNVAYIPEGVKFYSGKQPNYELLSHISRSLENDIEQNKLKTYNIEDLDKILKEVETDVNIQTITISDTGEEKSTNTGLSMAIAYISGMLIYILTFVFGAQVMRGVIEEKTSRIVEVLVSSVKPFQLMMGKIVGIALVGLTQFILWTVLSFIFVGIAQSVLLPDQAQQMPQQEIVQNIMEGQTANPAAGAIESAGVSPEMKEIMNVFDSVKNVNWGLILTSFIIFFLGGYLLYAAFFAAIGSAVDNETDTQQFMIPITIPLLLGLFVSMSAMENPESGIVFWFSLIPFTSPMVMMARLPFGVPAWELALSMLILIGSFISMTWLAAKIYRTGILMYGKKISYKELGKWLRYKNY